MIRFPSGTVDGLSCFSSIPYTLLNASPLNPGGLTMQGIDGLPSGLPFAGHTPFVRNLCLGLNLPIINTANIIPPPNLGVGVVPSVSCASAGCQNPVLCYPASVTQTAHSVIDSGPSDPSVHTIVRGPVMYTSASGRDLIQRSNGIHSSNEKNKEESPPDRIVASYAAAAHAAALACHQPISRAAEAYLATNSYNRSRHSKRPRALNHLSTVTISTTSNSLSTLVDTGSNYISSNLLSIPSSGSSLISSEATYGESHKGWTRLVNKKTQNVVYLTSDGTRLHNVDEVYTYLSTRNSECEINSSIKELIAAHFIFAPTIDGPSLEDTLNFVHRLQGSVLKDESVNDNVSQFLTTVSSSVNSDSVSQAVKSSEEVSACRVTFNPDYLPNSDLPAKRSKLSDDLLSSVCKPKEPSTLKGQSVNCSVNTTISACPTQSFVSSNNCELNILCTDALYTSPIDRIREGPSDFENNQFTHKQNLNNLSKNEAENFSTSSTSVFPDISSSRIKPSQLQNDSEVVAKLTTETLTTGALRTSLASLTTEVVPSVISPSKQIGVNATNFSLSDATSSCFDPSQANLATLNVLQQNSVNPLFTEQLLGISQMRHIQHPQQHNHNLSSGITVTVPTQNIIGNYPFGVLASQSLSNPILSSLTAEWLSNLRSSAQQSITSSTLPELTLNSAIDNLNATSVLQQYQQRQRFLTLAALQKHQQNQALALIQNAVLLQQQRNNSVANAAALVLRQQQEQQLAVASLQAQSYIAALQQQFTNSHT